MKVIRGQVIRGDRGPALEITGGEWLLEGCTLSAPGWEQVVWVRGGTVIFRGCRVEGGINRGIVVEGASAAVEGCVLAGNRVGLWASDAAEVSARSCQVEGPGSVGIFFQRGALGQVEGCDLRGLRDAGVCVRGGACPDLLACAVAAEAAGILFEAGGSGLVRGCRLEGARIGAWISAGAAPVFEGCDVEGCSSAGLFYQGGGAALGCQLVGNAVGICLQAGADPRIRECLVRGGASMGLYAMAGARGRVAGCWVEDHPHGAIVLEQGAETIVA